MKFPRKVYEIKHNITGRIYMGSTANLKNRLSCHLSKLRCGKHHIEDMQADYDKYGEDYSIRVLDEITTIKDKYKEYEWMKKFNSLERGVGYNYLDHKNDTKHFITINDEKITLSELASKTGIPEFELYRRLVTEKWDVIKAITLPRKVDERRLNKAKYELLQKIKDANFTASEMSQVFAKANEILSRATV